MHNYAGVLHAVICFLFFFFSNPVAWPCGLIITMIGGDGFDAW